MGLVGQVFGPQLDSIEKAIIEAKDVLVNFFRGDRKLHEAQSQNAEIADGFQQGSNNGTADTITIPNGLSPLAQPFSIFQDASDVNAKAYAYLIIEIDDTSGSGRHNAGDTSVTPTAGGVGHKIPAGGTEIVIPGSVNIKNFRMIAETGQTLNYTMQGFV